jgi:hypoxanthine phosphoribosyltransferase
VLLVEDVVDTGRTAARLMELLRGREPASLKLCALLDKPSRREMTVNIDYVGFSVVDTFVVGYGLDHAGLWRNLPYVGVPE